MSNNQPTGFPAPLQNFEPGVELLQEAPEEDARGGLDSTVHDEAPAAGADEATAVRRPPVVAVEDVPRTTLAQRWREHVEASRQQGA
ncbi:hypothetical protein [Streptomyces sp. NPDC088812]|uniref:hypothetical protein n=1 Tax=Streptomyces sp. NPDC088812 TaxID=3365905 RepID=UPI003810DDF6